MMNFRSKSSILAIAAVLMFASCKKNETNDQGSSLRPGGSSSLANVQTNFTGPWVVWGGKGDAFWSGTINGYNSLPASLSLPASGNLGVTYAVGGRAAFNYLYKLGSSNMLSRGIQRYTVSSSGAVAASGSALTFSGSPSFQQNEVNFYLYKTDTAYYTDGDASAADKLKLFRFNPTAATMTTSGYTPIDFSAVFNPAATNVTNPISTPASVKLIGSKIIIDRGDYIFVDVLFGNGYNSLKQLAQITNNAYIAAYNKTTGHITVSSFTNATNLGLFNDAPLVSLDQITGDIYLAAVGNMATLATSSKILKINAGSNVLNSSWNIDIDANYFRQGEFNTLFAHNNIIYTKFPNTDVTYLGSGHGVSYRSDIWEWAAIDATSKVKKNLNIPVDNYYCYQNPRLINNEIYFIYNNNSPAGTAGVKKITPLSSSTFSSATAPIATTAVSTLAPANSYIRIMGLDRL